MPFRRPFVFDTFPFELVRFRNTVSVFVFLFDLFVFDIIIVLKYKSENGKRVILTVFNPTTKAQKAHASTK